MCCQGATVGAHHGQYPVIGKGVSLLPNSSVIGRSNIEDGVSIGANCMLYEKDVERQSVVFNESGCNKVKRRSNRGHKKFFTVPVI